MKRNHALIVILFCEAAFFPLVILLTEIFHYTLFIDSGMIFAVLSTVIAYAAAIALLGKCEERAKGLFAVLLAVTPILSAVGTFFFCFTARKSPGAVALMLSRVVILLLCAAYCFKGVGLKILSFAAAILCTAPVILYLPFAVFFETIGGFGLQTVLVSEASPHGTFIAEVIDDNQGALGGNTILNVWRCGGSFSVGSFRFLKDYRNLHTGVWGEYRSFSWEDDTHLVLNGKRYRVT